MPVEAQQTKTTPLAKCQPHNNNDAMARIGRNKPIVMSNQRYNKIMDNAFKLDKIKVEEDIEKEQKYREYLKQGNDQLVANFKGNMQRTQEKKMQEIKQQLDKKFQQAIESNEQAKENAAKERSIKLARAHALVEKLKPGPRALKSAAIQSEVLRARNAQIEVKHEFEKAVQKQECLTQKLCRDTNLKCVNDDYERNKERQKNLKEYKGELLNTIKSNQNQKAEHKKKIIREQKAALEAIDSEIKAGIEREKAIMEKKRAALRNNAIEAMKMVEQRRQRNQMIKEVEDRLCCVYNNGKYELDKMREEHNKSLKDEFQKKIDAQAQQLLNLTKKAETMEAERVTRDISKMQLKFTAEEQEKIRKGKAAKQAHIEACLQEMQQLKLAKTQGEEEKRFEMAQRYKNDEVNCLFQVAAEQQKANKAREFQAELNEQIAENRNRRLAQRQKELNYKDDTDEKQHKFFFEYAHNLMADAQQKGRTLYPFVKVIEQYKRDNWIGGNEPKIPKHLRSQIHLGQNHTTTGAAGPQLNANNNMAAAQNSMISNYMKVNNILAKDMNNKKLQQTACYNNSNNTPGTSTGATRKQFIAKECNSKPSAIYRYSVQELKSLDHSSFANHNIESMTAKNIHDAVRAGGLVTEHGAGDTKILKPKGGSKLNADATPFTPRKK